MPVEKCVEGVEKLFLRSLLTAEKLDVVDQEQVRLSIALPKFDQVVMLDRVDEFVDEEFAGKVHDLRVFLLHPDVLTDRLHEVRLSESDPAVDKERVVSSSGRLRDRETGGVRNFVVRADDKRFETVSRIEPERGTGLPGIPRVFSCRFLSGKFGENLIVRFDGTLHGRRKLHLPRCAESSHDRHLQRRHMITFDPELINVVWNSKGKGVIGGVDKLNRGEPALKSVRTNLWLERCRQFLPELSVILVHTDLLTALINLPREGPRQNLRGEMQCFTVACHDGPQGASAGNRRPIC